jgi:molybdopterin-guanine dinucleotide biosynthesis protein A
MLEASQGVRAPRAYVLAGGRSTRFCSDKALATVGGRPLIQHAAKAFQAAGCAVTVVADQPGKYAALGLPTIADVQPGLGPLGGLLTALRDAGTAPAVLLAACDLHGWGPDWAAALLAAPPGAAIALFDTDPVQPLLGRYATALLPVIGRRIDAGRRSMHGLLDEVVPLRLPPPAATALINVNRREDLPPDHAPPPGGRA